MRISVGVLAEAGRGQAEGPGVAERRGTTSCIGTVPRSASGDVDERLAPST